MGPATSFLSCTLDEFNSPPVGDVPPADCVGLDCACCCASTNSCSAVGDCSDCDTNRRLQNTDDTYPAADDDELADCDSESLVGVRIGVFPTYTRVEVKDPLDPPTIIASVGGMFSFIGMGAGFVYLLGEKIGASVCGCMDTRATGDDLKKVGPGNLKV